MNLKGRFIGHYNATAAEGGVWLTAWADGPGYMSVARLHPVFTTPPRRRGVR